MAIIIIIFAVNFAQRESQYVSLSVSLLREAIPRNQRRTRPIISLQARRKVLLLLLSNNRKESKLLLHSSDDDGTESSKIATQR